MPFPICRDPLETDRVERAHHYHVPVVSSAAQSTWRNQRLHDSTSPSFFMSKWTHMPPIDVYRQTPR